MENLTFNNSILSYDVKSSMVDDFAIKMIEENLKSDYLVPIAYSQDENTITFNTDDLIPLSEIMEQSLDGSKILSIFWKICEIINYSKLHMLYENNLILDINYIFINQSDFNLQMVYIPIEENPTEVNIKNFFKELIFNFETDDYITTSKLFKKINKKTFDFNDFFEFLKNETQQLNDNDNNIDNTNDDTSNKSTLNEETYFAEEISPKADYVETEIEKPSNINQETIAVSDTSMMDNSDTPQDNENTPNYTTNSANDMKSISITPNTPTEPNKDDINNRLNSKFLNPFTDFQTFSKRRYMDEVSVEGVQTALDTPVEEPPKPSMEDLSKTATLVRTKDNSTKVINKKYFIIGKLNDTDFPISDNNAISRSHATIITEDNTYYISDNGSSNGTWVNNKRVTQDDKVMLRNLDVITLASDNEKLIFHIK